MKHLEVRRKYSAARLIFNSLLSVSSGDETLRLRLDILLQPDWKIGSGTLNGSIVKVDSHPGTQLGAQNKESRAVSQADFSEVYFHLWRRLPQIQFQFSQSSLIRSSHERTSLGNERDHFLKPELFLIPFR